MGYSGLELRFRPRALIGGMAEYLIGARYRAAPLEPVAQLPEEAEVSGPLAARNGYEFLLFAWSGAIPARSASCSGRR